MEEIKVKKKKPLFSRFEWICIIIFAVFGIVGLILHFLGYDDIKGNAAEVQSLASQTDYLLVSKNDPYIMIGTPDPDGELETTVLKVDSFGFYNYFKAPADLIIDPFHSAFVGWNTLYNAIVGVSNTTINDGSSLLRYRMSAGNLNEFTGYMPATIISHQDYNIVKGCIYAEGGGYAWLSTSNFVKPAPVPRIQGDLINAYYFYVWEGDSSHYYAVTTTGALHLHRASSSDAASRIVYRDGMMLYSYESGAWQGPIGASQSMLDGLGLPYIMNFENAAGMVMYDDACMAAVWMQSFPDQQTIVSPTPSPSPIPSVTQSLLFYGSPRYGNGLFSSAGYYLFDFVMASVPDSVDVELQNNSSLAFAMSNYNVASPWVYNVILHYAQNSYSNINIYLKGICQSVKVYYLGSYLASQDYEFLRQNYSSQDFVNNTSYSYWTTSNGITGMNLYFNNDSFSFVSSSFSFNNQTVSLTPGGLIQLFYYNSSSADSPLVQAYRYGLSGAENSPGGPSPSPSPSPSPIPTVPPYVVIITPQPEATPTPVVKLDPVFPSSMPPLSSGTVSSVLETGNTYLDNNNAITVLSRALAFVPNTVLSLWWFWLFVLVILAGIRVFIHFF